MPTIAGIDEVGRGSLAGPIMAAVAVFDESLLNCPVPNIKDSKKYNTEAHREAAFCALLQSPALLDFSWGEVSHTLIDSKGIEWANQDIFRQCLSQLRIKPDYLIVDGPKKVKSWHGSQWALPKADRDNWQVSAASVIAKVIRDRLMRDYAQVYPGYEWEKNKGYGSEEHQAALVRQGLSAFHRRSFCKRWL